jgi:hypothetical protein
MKKSPRIKAAEAHRATYRSEPCKHGHDGTRYVSNGVCVECSKATSAARHALIRKLRQS